ncbi:signal recognition particle-docking protein FtsY [Enterovirga sp. CN4-39]|uniref:signal recognition particle-docking protein FtsY n=1 Tax=Enterovirga sp. CN4-39 TaxID=3400910 RepID=UPI003C0580D9
MALQGRKPGWFLDKLLGRNTEERLRQEAEAEHVADMAPAAAPEEPLPEPPALSPASVFEGQPDFIPAAEPGELPAAPPTVTEASPDTVPFDKPVAELDGASLQPVEGQPEGGGPTEPVPRLATPAGSPAIQPAPASPIAVPAASPPAPIVAPAPPPAPEPVAPPPPEPAEQRGWWRRLTEGMRRTSSSIGDSVTGLFTKKKLDRATLDDLEDVLIGADLGIETATRITEAVGAGRYDREISPDEVKKIMAGEIEKVLAPVAVPLSVDRGKKPFVLLMIGVNGAGKTTTIGKLAQKFRRDGLSVVIAAGDTFRAAAIEQLKVWGERVGAPVIAKGQGADAAGLAFDALTEARERGADVLMIDTAGRLQNKAGLMAELEKIIRVIRKVDPEAPHASLLVLDATVGQNALSQVELFAKTAGVTGLVMTKLDGTARGGILVALAAKFGLPVHFIGVGEGVEDLEPFTARDFARAIAGLDQSPTLH